MTDRERLLEQVGEQECLAEEFGEVAVAWLISSDRRGYAGENAVTYAKDAAHHALTAMALRDVIRPAEPMLACARCQTATGPTMILVDGSMYHPNCLENSVAFALRKL